ncbi:hypothetical protein N7539_003317 [Penicillium diatomitis]|uniref:Uncharacterized protein n=1 Tax=Penicillium diatomitis TaxID=2819901 RepID=A0A9W9XGD5_9EURO|nr:uncharacterized protein N7539_003317 [Penicillium diatomitis]KAJ5491750.1 hypothetical protein N7539_003317 [Penicillium diatomitis]
MQLVFSASFNLKYLLAKKSQSSLIAPAMDVLPPLITLRLNRVITLKFYFGPPQATLEVLYTCCVNGGVQSSCEITGSQDSSSESFDICDLQLCRIMTEAIKRNDSQFIQELLGHVVAIDPLYGLQALNTKAKEALEVFHKNRWDIINKPISELESISGTPLQKAAELGKADVSRYSVRKGSNLNILDAKGRTVVVYARILNQ